MTCQTSRQSNSHPNELMNPVALGIATPAMIQYGFVKNNERHGGAVDGNIGGVTTGVSAPAPNALDRVMSPTPLEQLMVQTCVLPPPLAAQPLQQQQPQQPTREFQALMRQQASIQQQQELQQRKQQQAQQRRQHEQNPAMDDHQIMALQQQLSALQEQLRQVQAQGRQEGSDQTVSTDSGTVSGSAASMTGLSNNWMAVGLAPPPVLVRPSQGFDNTTVEQLQAMLLQQQHHQQDQDDESKQQGNEMGSRNM